MKIRIAAIGKSKAGPELQLMQDYTRRLSWKCDSKETDIKLENAGKRKEREGEWLLETCKGYDCLIALDEGGRLLSSREFAQWLGQAQQQGLSSFAFVIGGADGLHEAVLKQVRLRFSLGRVTWPHMLVRALLAEQLYRAQCLLSGHPYHRD